MLKPGYKQTDAGIIPIDWKAVTLGSVIQLQRGFDLPHRLRTPGIVPIISSSGTLDTHNKSLVVAPGVVTGRYGTIGEVFYIEKDFWPLNTTLFVKDFKNNNPLYISYILKTIDFASHSGKSGVPGINRNDLHELIIGFPSELTEQQAIAEALGAVDSLLTSQQQLLAKKHALKLATQQALLSGERRLPGFAGEWQEKTLGDCFEKVIGGGTPSRGVEKFWGGPIPWVTVKDLSSFDPYKAQEFITAEALANSASHLIPKGTLIISTRMAVGRAVIYAVDVAINQDLKAIFINSNANKQFLYYWLQMEEENIASGATGSTVKGLQVGDLKALPVRLPSLAEQRAIAAILSDMDAELEALAAQLAKTQALKQGLMQDLLTGTIRLTAGAAPTPTLPTP